MDEFNRFETTLSSQTISSSIMLLKTGAGAKGDGEPCLNAFPDTAAENVPIFPIRYMNLVQLEWKTATVRHHH